MADRIKLLTGAEYISLSDQVRRQAGLMGLNNPSRGELQIFANRMRQENGNGVFADLSIPEAMKKDSRIVLINGVRHPDEILAIRSHSTAGNVTILGVDASRETRFERVVKRQRPSDPKTWEEFIICDIRENGDPNRKEGQQNYQCLVMSDLTILNNTNNLNSLEYIIDSTVDRLISVGHLRNYFPESGTLGDFPQKMLIVTNGVHGAGKTTVGKLVAVELRIPYKPEIGGQLRQEVDYNAMESATDFDREVMRRELMRDHQVQRDSNEAFILETWHTGNIAYALERNPKFAQTYMIELARQLKKFNVFHCLFQINDQTFINRATERVHPGEMNSLVEFYRRIEDHTIRLYQNFQLSFSTVDNNGDLTEAHKTSSNLTRAHLGVI